jgi:hypothetical protein
MFQKYVDTLTWKSKCPHVKIDSHCSNIRIGLGNIRADRQRPFPERSYWQVTFSFHVKEDAYGKAYHKGCNVSRSFSREVANRLLLRLSCQPKLYIISINFYHGGQQYADLTNRFNV